MELHGDCDGDDDSDDDSDGDDDGENGDGMMESTACEITTSIECSLMR